MIIDADCHVSSHKFDGLAMLASELIAHMERAGVEKALIWPKPPYDKNIEPENKAIYEAAKAFPGRLIPFGWVNPLLGEQRTLDNIKRCCDEYGVVGMKFNGAQDSWVIDDPAYRRFIEAAAGYGKVLAFHIGADFYENTHPNRLGRIAAELPETRFLMIHMGGAGVPHLARWAIEVAQRNANVTLLGSTIDEMAILKAIETLGPQRVCFGSDMPYRLMHVQLAMYRALLPRDSDEAARDAVLGGNVARLVGII